MPRPSGSDSTDEPARPDDPSHADIPSRADDPGNADNPSHTGDPDRLPDLRPSTADAPVPPAPTAPPVPAAPDRLSPATVWWALLPILLPGFGAPIAFGVGVSRRPSPATVIPLIVYTVAVVAFCGLPVLIDQSSVLTAIWALSVLVPTVGACGHLFAIRHTVWGASDNPALPSPRPPEPGVPLLEHTKRLRDAARQIAEHDPMLAKQLRIGRPDLPRANDDGGLVDLNHAPLEVLSQLPGFNRAAAERVRERVERAGPFQSIEDVIFEIEIAPGFEKHLREYALLLP